MHLICAIQSQYPEVIMPGNIDKFLKHISSKTYENTGINSMTGWSQIRAREIRFFDFTIPERVEEQVLIDLAPHVAGKLNRIPKVLNTPIFGKMIQNIAGLKPIDIEPHRGKAKNPEAHSVYLTILGKVEDEKHPNGKERL